MAKKEDPTPGTEMEQMPEGGVVEGLDNEMLREMEAAAADAKRDMTMDDVRIPQLVLVQGTHNIEGVAAGMLWHSLTGEANPSVDVVIGRMYKTRALFSGNIGDPPKCSSSNALDGWGEPGDALKDRGPNGGGDCTRCPEANWRSGGKCQLRYNYLAVVVGDNADLTHDLPVNIQMHGTSAKVATRLNSLLVGARFPWSNALKVSSKVEENEKGTFRTWDISKAREATPEEMRRAFEISKITVGQGYAVDPTNGAPADTTVATPAGEKDDGIPF